MQIIWIRMPAQRLKCKEPWTKSHGHGITMTSQSAQKEAVHQPAPGKPYNEPTITVNGQKLKVVDKKFTYLGSTLSKKQCTLIMRSLPELQNPVWHSDDSMQMSGSAMESLTPS